MKKNQKDKSIRHDKQKRHAFFVRVLALGLFWFYDIYYVSDSLGIIVLFGLTMFTVLCHYIDKNSKIIFFEALYIGILSLIDPRFTILFTFPIFEAIVHSHPLVLIAGAALVLVSEGLKSFDVLLYLFAIVLGSLYALSDKEKKYYQEESDQERRKRYELERMNQEYLTMLDEVHNMAEISERDRIAQELHDNVGHELTGAVLSLQAFRTVLEDYELELTETKRFNDLQKRVNNSAKLLREAVYRMKPFKDLGAYEFQTIIERFDLLPTKFSIYGDPDLIPSYYWLLLKTALQEGLTNIMRYSNPKEVLIQLDITSSIVRFELKNDGVIENEIIHFDKEIIEGMGHRNLKLRTKAYGGNFSAINLPKTNSYKTVVVLPLKKEE